jgi:hypothetical protein
MKSPWEDVVDPDGSFTVDIDCDYKEVSKRADVRWDPQGDGTYELIIIVSTYCIFVFRLLSW